MTVPIYDPHHGTSRRPVQAIRPLSPRSALALYLYEMLVLIVVVGAFAAVINQ